MSQFNLFSPYTPKNPNLPYAATVVLHFNEPLVVDPDSQYYMFYANGWNTPDAENMKDIKGNIVGGPITSNSITLTIPIYTFPTELTITAMGLHTATWTQVNYTVFDAPEEYKHGVWLISQYDLLYDNNTGVGFKKEPDVDIPKELGDNTLI